MKRLFVLLLATMLLLLSASALADDGQDAEDNGNTVDTAQLPDSSFVYDVSIAELQDADSYLESRTVQVTGEAVGDIIYDEVDKNHRWITVNALPGETEATIQVYATADQAAKIDTLGRYQVTGSTVSVMGEFHLVCGQHDGITDLHAASLTVTRPGSQHRASFDAKEFAPALLLVLLGGAFFMFYHRKREELR